MSVLKVNQIRAKIRNLFESYLDLSDISATDAGRDVKILSRCLAALAIYIEADCTPQDAAEAVWDGSEDNGVDAAYYDPANNTVVLVQSKWISQGSGEPSAADVNTFTRGVEDLIEHDDSSFHTRLAPKVAQVLKHLDSPGTSVSLLLISTGSSKLAKHASARVTKLLKSLNGSAADPVAMSRVIGLTEVYTMLAGDVNQSGVSLEATLLDWSHIPSPYPAYFGIIDGSQLKTWWKTHGRRLVAANIRHSLGATDVNLEIRTTAQTSPERFWYFNNGITLIAENATKAPSKTGSRAAGVFAFRCASIVNGAQTVSSIARVDDDTKLGDVRVPIRIVLLKNAPTGFGDDVARTNNLQNRIEARDFVAQDMEQKRLREEMAIEQVAYHYVRSDEVLVGTDSCDLVEVTTALACASGDINLVVQVKTGIGRFFADLRRPPYRAIFNPSLSGARSFNAVLVLRAVDTWIAHKKKSLPKKSGPSWSVLVHANRILAAAVFQTLKPSLLDQPIVQFRTAMSELPFDQFCETAYNAAVACVNKRFKNRFLGVLIKNPTESRTVFHAASGR